MNDTIGKLGDNPNNQAKAEKAGGITFPEFETHFSAIVVLSSAILGCREKKDSKEQRAVVTEINPSLGLGKDFCR